MRGVVTVREHEKLENDPALTKQDMADLEAIARKVLKRKDGDLAASNYVGVVTTKRGVVVEDSPEDRFGWRKRIRTTRRPGRPSCGC